MSTSNSSTGMFVVKQSTKTIVDKYDLYTFNKHQHIYITRMKNIDFFLHTNVDGF